MKKPIGVVLIVMLTVALVGVTGCAARQSPSPSSEGPAREAKPSAGGVAVSIQNHSFSPRNVTVRVGDTVTWTNKDNTTHTVTGTGFVSGQLAPGQTYSHKFDAAGTYQYLCSIHTTMSGIVVVQ